MKPAAPTGQPAMPSSGEREELARVLFVAADDNHNTWPTPEHPECLKMADAILSAGYRRAAGWRPISEASRETCAEILGVQFLGGRMMREPFISFWSPTLNKFYCDPTHFMLLPPSPEDAKP